MLHIFIKKDNNNYRVNFKFPNGNEYCDIFNFTETVRGDIDNLYKTLKRNSDDNLIFQLGGKLFNLIFNNTCASKFHDFFDCANSNKPLRILLEIESDLPHIEALPWEFLCVPTDSKRNGCVKFSTNGKLSFSRKKDLHSSPSIINLDEKPIRVLVVVANIENIGRVQYESITKKAEEIQNRNKDKVNFDYLYDATNISIIEKINLFKPHIFHFIGHGKANDDNEKLAIFDGSGTGFPEWIDSKNIGWFNNHKVDLAIIQACESGRNSQVHKFKGIASRILQKNIPIVIAMQHKVSNYTANIFSEKFYELFFEEDFSVEKSVQLARFKVESETMYGKYKIDFATPVLYITDFENEKPQKCISPEEVQKILFKLNFEKQERDFSSFKNNSKFKRGAIFISNEDDGFVSKWLIGKLINKFFKNREYKKIEINLSSSISTDNYLLEQLFVWSNAPKRDYDEIGNNISKFKETKNVFIIINGVNNKNEEIVINCWKRISNNISNNSNFWFLMFINKDKVNSDIRLDDSIIFHEFNENFTKDDFYYWFEEEQVKEIFNINGNDNIKDKLINGFLEYKSRIPTIASICKCFNIDYWEQESKWLKI